MQPASSPMPPASQPESAPTGTDQTTKPKSPLQQYMLPVIMIGLLLLFVLMGRKPRKEEKKRQEMLANLKKGDRIVTIGGIKGSIVEMRDDEVVVKVDESSNTRIKFVRSAIRAAGTEDESAAKKDENKP